MRMNTSLTVPFPNILSEAFTPYALFLVGLALLFGGGTQQGLWSDVPVLLASLPLLPWAVVRLTSIHLGRLGRWAIVILCATIAMPLLQLIPLPPALWSSLPGRGEIASTYQVAGITVPWLPISLTPAATWRGCLSLLPAIAIFLSVLSLGYSARQRMIILILVAAVVSLPLDLLQTIEGPESGLRFYAITNLDRAVGFFANANHHAAFLACAISLACAFAVGATGDEQPRRYVALMLAGFLAAVAVALSLTVSRAGVALGFLAGMCGLGLGLRQSHGRSRRRLLIYGSVAIIAMLLLVFQFGFVGFVGKSVDMMDDLRWPVAKVTWRAANAFFPLGSGFGSFIPVYEMFAPLTMVREHYVNHAHDDWLELWLTGGAPALVLTCAFLLWFGCASVSLWGRNWPGSEGRDMAIARSATIIVILLLLHSTVDYPLRTVALSVLFALGCGLLVSPAVSERSTQNLGHQPHARRHSARESNSSGAPL